MEPAQHLESLEPEEQQASTDPEPSPEPTEPAAAPAPQADEPAEEGKVVPLAALEDERKKRQERDAELARLREEAAFLRGQTVAAKPTPAAPKPEELEQEFFENPTGFIDKRLRSVEERVVAAWNARHLDRSVAAAKQRHDDYGEKEALFIALANEQPNLAAAMRDHHDPAEFAYQQASLHLEAQKHGGSLADMRAALEKQIREEYEAKHKQTAALDAANQVTRTQAGATGTSPTAARPVQDDSLDDVLKANGF